MGRPRKPTAEIEDIAPVTVRFPRAVKDEAVRLADIDRRSLNQWLVLKIEDAIAREKTKKGG